MNRGAAGNYWSSTANSSSEAYDLGLSASLGPGTSTANKNSGGSIRCLISGA
ncbi:hypothetical protein J6S37_02975 [Candidatus Saccharibacteria bacterium]|nr:hypothetical protein [Candidatus Saccharibacteria bacterium]